MDDRVPLVNGSSVRNAFIIESELGRGGFGITYRAVALENRSHVALKEFFPLGSVHRQPGYGTLQVRTQEAAFDYAKGLERVIAEAKTLLMFRHPNIVQLKQLFRDNNTLYLVLSYEHGVSLKEWVSGLGRAPSQQEFDQLLQPLLKALTVIHNSRHLHRDIAPDNIFLRGDGTPVLLDFGSARAFSNEKPSALTLIIKPGFSPHEQYLQDSSHQGPFTDIYSLGATLYSIITKDPPPDGRQRYMEWRATDMDYFQPIDARYYPQYRPAFLGAINNSLELETSRRPQSVRQWERQLFAANDTLEQGSLQRHAISKRGRQRQHQPMTWRQRFVSRLMFWS